MAERVVRYCTTEDGVRIAYCVEGEGPVLLVCPAFVESFAHEELVFFQRLRMRELAANRTLIRYDMRGTGLSQRDVRDSSHEALVQDIEAVVRATSPGRLCVLAINTSGPRAIEFSVRHPDAVSSLILYTTFARAADVWAPAAVDAIVNMVTVNWELASQVIGDASFARRRDDPERALARGEQTKRSASPEAVARFLQQAYPTTDVSAILPEVRAMTLVLHRTDDDLFPFNQAQRMASLIPNAKLVTLPTVQGMPGQEALVRAIKEFFIEIGEMSHWKTAAVAARVNAVLFTDLVGHTEMMSRLGDERGREVLREHERITRELLNAHGGTEVKTMGDGFMASFGSVTKAVECAVALQRAMEQRNQRSEVGGQKEALRVRIGLNAGEPIEEDGDLFGATVILASRIAAKAEGGEILVADTVRGLCSGKGFLFADKGEFVAKGFEEPVRVYEVRWGSEQELKGDGGGGESVGSG